MDIDIDFIDRKAAAKAIKHIPATIFREGEMVKHPSGVYVQDIPFDPQTGLATLPHDGDHPYFKIDLLNNSIYDGVIDEGHLIELLEREPDWLMLGIKDIVDSLPHLRNHFDIVDMIKPASVEDLAVVLALMRPAKRYLLGKSREEIDEKIWVNEGEGYAFKRSHAIAYAVSIVVKMNIMVEEITLEMTADQYITFA